MTGIYNNMKTLFAAILALQFAHCITWSSQTDLEALSLITEPIKSCDTYDTNPDNDHMEFE